MLKGLNQKGMRSGCSKGPPEHMDIEISGE